MNSSSTNCDDVYCTCYFLALSSAFRVTMYLARPCGMTQTTRERRPRFADSHAVYGFSLARDPIKKVREWPTDLRVSNRAHLADLASYHENTHEHVSGLS